MFLPNSPRETGGGICKGFSANPSVWGCQNREKRKYSRADSMPDSVAVEDNRISATQSTLYKFELFGPRCISLIFTISNSENTYILCKYLLDRELQHCDVLWQKSVRGVFAPISLIWQASKSEKDKKGGRQTPSPHEAVISCLCLVGLVLRP